MNTTEKRQLLNSFAGKFFTATWTVKDGTTRVANCKHFNHDAFTLGHASLALDNPVAHKPQYFTACDQNKDGKWVNINLETLAKVSCNGKVYTF